MSLITIVGVYDGAGTFISAARTRTELAKIVPVPIHSRNESGAWNVEDPDAVDSLSGVDEVSIELRTSFLVRVHFVSPEKVATFSPQFF